MASSNTPDDLASVFQVSENAFLPESPLEALPGSYYEPWELLAAHLPTLLKTNRLRDEVAQLPVLSIDRLASKAEAQRAYSILSFLAHGYIWGGSRPAEILPPCLSIPLLVVSAQLELPPVATYAALNLWNWAYRNDAAPGVTATPRDLDRLVAQRTFTGTESESWFYVVSVAMEAEGGGVIPAVLRALQAVHAHSTGNPPNSTASADCAYAATLAALEAVTACIRRLSALLARMPEHCDPDTFYHGVRPFLAGSLGMGHTGLPRGVFYDEGDGKGVWRQLRGGSNGQSSLIQFLDRALGVEHGGHGTAGTGQPQPAVGFHEEVLGYMPGPHRQLLQAVSGGGSDGSGLRTFALQGDGPSSSSSSDGGRAAQQRRCRDAYHEAVDAMTEMRNGHLQIVARYIVLPSKRPWTGPDGHTNLASASSGREDAEKLTGTGGTALMSFLRTARDDTAAAGQDKERV